MKRYDKLIRNPGEREAAVLSFWEEHDTFNKTLETTKGGPRYVFFEGPPTANGKPHFGHLMPRVYKDLFPRFQTMRGCLQRPIPSLSNDAWQVCCAQSRMGYARIAC